MLHILHVTILLQFRGNDIRQVILQWGYFANGAEGVSGRLIFVGAGYGHEQYSSGRPKNWASALVARTFYTVVAGPLKVYLRC